MNAGQSRAIIGWTVLQLLLMALLYFLYAPLTGERTPSHATHFEYQDF